MAKTAKGLKRQYDKITAAVEKTTPPVPSDEFELHKAEVLGRLGMMNQFLEGAVSGEGSLTIPAAEPEG